MKKVLYILLGIVVIAGGVYAVLYYNTSLSVKAEPQGSSISIDQKTVSSGEKLSIKPGSHEISITRDDYIPYRKLTNVGFGDQEIVNITLRPLPIPEKIVTKQARFPIASLDGKSIYYLSEKTMYAIEGINTETLKFEAISPDFFEDVTDVVWAPNQELAIIKQSAKTSLYNFQRYDLLRQEITPFDDEGIKDTVWSSDSKNIMYYYEPGTGERTLVKATPSNTDKEIVYNFKDTDIKNPKIDWSPNMEDVLIVANSKIYLLNLYTNSMSVISGEEKVLEGRFTPDNNILMIAQSGDYIVDKITKAKQQLDLNTNLQRITFVDAKNMVLSEKLDNKYNFYTYNIPINDKKELYYNKKVSVNPIDNILTSNEKYLYFESNKFLYKMSVDTGEY